jgi:hypothetical protein
MRKQSGRLMALTLCCLLLAGCTAAPPDSVIREDADKSLLISADTAALTPDTVQATLYFRYGATEYLAPEERSVPVQRNETAEKALVQALLDGPAATSSALSPLFPPGTEVLAVSSQGSTLFITFSEALRGRYADEPVDTSGQPWKEELPLRRHLCMDSLAATLTEAGLCSQVHVLVYRSGVPTHSMRLQAGFYNRGLDEAILPPLTRNEDALLTPRNTASAILRAWMNQDWLALYGWLARDSRPGEQTALGEFSTAKILTGYDVSAGTVSLNGQSAVLCADLSLRASGEDAAREGYPIHLTREDGLWRIEYSRLMDMIQAE